MLSVRVLVSREVQLPLFWHKKGHQYLKLLLLNAFVVCFYSFFLPFFQTYIKINNYCLLNLPLQWAISFVFLCLYLFSFVLFYLGTGNEHIVKWVQMKNVVMQFGRANLQITARKLVKSRKCQHHFQHTVKEHWKICLEPYAIWLTFPSWKNQFFHDIVGRFCPFRLSCFTQRRF